MMPVESAPRGFAFLGGPHNGTVKYPGGQRAWIEAALTHKCVVIAVGRRAGKTSGFRFLTLEEAALTDGFYEAAYIAQGHAQAQDFYESCKRDWTPSGMVVRAVSQGQTRYIELRPFGKNSGARLNFWSGEEGALDNVRGKGLHRVGIDEAGFQAGTVMTVVGPMLVDRNGRIVIFGTPKPEGKGFAWFRQEYMRGVDRPGEPRWEGYRSFSAPSESNPYLDPEAILKERLRLRVRADTPSIEERSEFDAEFVDSTGAVFENIDPAFSIAPIQTRTITGGCRWIGEVATPGDLYVAGVDFGRFVDWTVVTIFSRTTKRQVALLHVTKIPFHEQLPHIHEILSLYGRPMVVADSRDAGQPLVEALQARFGDFVIGAKITHGGEWDKEGLVTKARMLFQEGGWSFLKVPEQQEEFRLFSKERRGVNQDGWSYNAPPGLHDDHVMAACLATRYLMLPMPGTSRKAAIEPFTRAWYENGAKESARAEKVRRMYRRR